MSASHAARRSPVSNAPGPTRSTSVARETGPSGDARTAGAYVRTTNPTAAEISRPSHGSAAAWPERGGRALASDLRAPLEARFSTSLADVRIHDSSEANALARHHRANALTVGSNIYFRKGRYRPTERAGRELLLHEITHVLQQRPGVGGATRDAAELEAKEAAGRASTAGRLAPIRRHLARPTVPLCDAASLKASIEGELDDIFVGIDNVWPQIRRESQTARDTVRNDAALERWIRREVSPMELLKTYLLLRFQTEARYPPHYEGLIEATDLVGTHEARIYSILRGVTPAERQEMQRMPGVVEVLEDELSGSELRLAWKLLYEGVERQATDVSSARTSVHLERSERFQLSVGTGESLATVEKNLTAATSETLPDVLLSDTSLWAEISDEFDVEETWYLRMITRYRGKDHFPHLTGPATPRQSFLFPIWEAVKGAGTDETKLIDTLAAAGRAPGITGGRRSTAADELRDDPWFIPMLEDEMSGDDLRRALTAVSAPGTTASGPRDSLRSAIDAKDMARIRTLLTDRNLSAADRRQLRSDPLILQEIGDELDGWKLCETSLLLEHGNTPLRPEVATLLSRFRSDPIDVNGAVTFLRGLTGSAGALANLRSEPGIFFMLANADVPSAERRRLLAALQADQPAYQEPGSEGTFRHHRESVRSRIPVHFTSSEVRVVFRCNIDTTRMRSGARFDTDLVEDWLRAIDEAWNGKYVLRNDGHTFDLVCQPYMALGLSPADVTIFVMNWQDRSFARAVFDPGLNLFVEGEMHLYLEDLEPIVVAHEFGHILGNPDEYALTPSEYARLTGSPGRQPAPRGGETVHGMMGSHYESTEIASRHLSPALEVINAVRDQTAFPNRFILQRK